MGKDEKMQLTEGSEYKIISLGGKDKSIETYGFFRGFISVGLDENGLVMELGSKHEDLQGKMRIIPLQVVLAIDVLEMKENDKVDDEKGVSHYVG